MVMYERRFFEFPWSRSRQGVACDGLSQFDLTKFNPWYFKRLAEFARLSDQMGTILVHNYYLQHHFLEQQTHYVDFSLETWKQHSGYRHAGLQTGG